MDRTLYLNESREMTIVRDGPSLWIMMGNKAGRRVPARLVSRVIITGNVKLDTSVITLFTESGKPVLFLNRKGDILATAFGMINPNWRIKERQTLFFTNKIYRPRVMNWINARRRNNQLQLLKHLAYKDLKLLTSKGLRERDFKRIIASYLPEDGDIVCVIKGTVTGLLHELITDSLLASELDPHLGVLHRRYNLGLVRDLSYIIETEAIRQSIQFFRMKKWEFYLDSAEGEWLLNAGGMKSIAMRFENQRKELEEMIDSLIDDIFQLMRELSI